jgi:glyoxylase I family protein
MPIQSIHHVSLIVADSARALTFYHDLLGLAPVDRPAMDFPGAWLAIGDGQLHLLELPNPDPVEGRPAHVGRDRHLALGIDQLAPLEARLRAAGVTFSRSRSGRAAIFCRDPDGNGIEIVEIQAG